MKDEYKMGEYKVVRIPMALYEELVKIKMDTGVSISFMTNQALREYIDKIKGAQNDQQRISH